MEKVDVGNVLLTRDFRFREESLAALLKTFIAQNYGISAQTKLVVLEFKMLVHFSRIALYLLFLDFSSLAYPRVVARTVIGLLQCLVHRVCHPDV